MESKVSQIRIPVVSICLGALATWTLASCGQGPSVIDGLGAGDNVVLVPTTFFTNTAAPVNFGMPQTWILESVGTSVLLPEELADAQVMAAFAGQQGQRVIFFRLTDWRSSRIKSTLRKELEDEAYLDLDDPGELFAIAAAGLRGRSPSQLLGIAVAEVRGSSDHHLGVVAVIPANSSDALKTELVRSVKSFSVAPPK